MRAFRFSCEVCPTFFGRLHVPVIVVLAKVVVKEWGNKSV